MQNSISVHCANPWRREYFTGTGTATIMPVKYAGWFTFHLYTICRQTSKSTVTTSTIMILLIKVIAVFCPSWLILWWKGLKTERRGWIMDLGLNLCLPICFLKKDTGWKYMICIMRVTG